MKTLIQVRSNDGFSDGPWSIGIYGVGVQVPRLCFPTRKSAEKVVRAIVNANPSLYTDRREDGRYGKH